MYIQNNFYYVLDLLVDEMCDFENFDMCRYQFNCIIGFKFQWVRGFGEIFLREIGLYYDGSGNLLGRFFQILDLLFKC